MTPEEKLNKLLSSIKDVREKQKSYFKARKSNALPYVTAKLLEDSKEAEKELDKVIAEIEKKEDTQINLF